MLLVEVSSERRSIAVSVLFPLLPGFLFRWRKKKTGNSTLNGPPITKIRFNTDQFKLRLLLETRVLNFIFITSLDELGQFFIHSSSSLQNINRFKGRRRQTEKKREERRREKKRDETRRKRAARINGAKAIQSTLRVSSFLLHVTSHSIQRKDQVGDVGFASSNHWHGVFRGNKNKNTKRDSI